MLRLRIVLCLFVFLAALGAGGAVRADSLKGAYTDPDFLSILPFGTMSQWVQPWRAYQETQPASTFLNGIGIGLKTDNMNPDLECRLLAEYGFTQARTGGDWGHLNWDETSIGDARFREAVRACKRYGIRPTVLIYCHQGGPCPVKFFQLKLATAARKGDRTVVFDHPHDIRVGYTGISNLTDYWAAEALITAMDGDVATLSKPMPKDIAAGAEVNMAELKYRPFSKPGTPDYAETIKGWLKNLELVGQTYRELLGTQTSADKGFDVEIWNELTFGTKFLYINSYYDPPLEKYDENVVWGNLVRESAAYMDAHPEDWKGVHVEDSFANTIPWTASSQEPARVVAIGKHPYPPRLNFPGDQRKGRQINALLKPEDPVGFVPQYSAFFPEYGATAIQTETLIRDMAPWPNEIYGTPHGRFARRIDGKIVPCSVWFTECNCSPIEADPNVTAERAMDIKAKVALRFFCFYLNKGVTRIHLFAATPNETAQGDKELGVLPMKFIQAASQPGALYPSRTDDFAGPILTAVRRTVHEMKAGLDGALTEARPLRISELSDTHNHVIFKGDGTPAHPDLFDRDVFAFLPFQVNARKFVIPIYVITRNVMVDLAPEKFTLRIEGVEAAGAKVWEVDPYTGKQVPVRVVKRYAKAVTVEVTVTDRPYLLEIAEK